MEAIVRVCIRVLVRVESCDDRAAARRVELESSEFERTVRAVNMELGGLREGIELRPARMSEIREVSSTNLTNPLLDGLLLLT